jgi:hypothetical protein
LGIEWVDLFSSGNRNRNTFTHPGIMHVKSVAILDALFEAVFGFFRERVQEVTIWRSETPLNENSGIFWERF